MTALPLTSFVTLLVTLLLFLTAINVGRARGRYDIKPPHVTGHELFERAYRIQMNTLEGAVMMLPALWLYASFVGDHGAGVMGGIWLVARVWYAVGYQSDPAKRLPGLRLSLLASVGLWLGALWGIVRVLVR